ncbi:aminodeoxychorismate/anthranilate synthase component II [Glaciecola sp. MH2013]|uniref:anthranilate synthase component II n=1 Tax=Glaciecola sp. MH2013 TaxID=2785524 RepID=UPI0018A0E87C|nr:aminodeoxychorismate/anthranilate synthase component II [Glaciecola sp. MH2013]MBF7073762.1 aminodeoxychorismate/anthranilate synthase component II [Glaciecola sp. MH2013]
MIIVIDNYDSFTYNLVRYFEELDAEVLVVKNDQVTIEELEALDFTHLVLSPGPCTPNESGICMDAIRKFSGRKAILGVCLGHQAIAQVYGAEIVRAQNIKHGKTSNIQILKEGGIFAGIESPFTATRYHSLLVEKASLPKSFSITAVCDESDDIEIMGIEHNTLAIYGVQFHPESLLTTAGHKILNNFLKL